MVKFCMQVLNPSLRWQTTPNHIFVVGEAKHFKCRVLIDTEEYECMRDILLPKGMCWESRDLFKFWEISDNVSETMQDWYIVAMKD